MAQIAQVKHHWLERLPSEVFNKVMASMVPVIPEIAENLVDEYEMEDGSPKNPWHKSTNHRVGLLSACLASKTLYDAARESLYHTIVLLDPAAISLLLRTLVENHRYGTWTRILAHPVDPNRTRNLPPCVSRRHAILKSMDPTLLSASPHLTVQMLNGTRDGSKPTKPRRFAQGLVAVILGLVPRLQTLLLQTPRRNMWTPLPAYTELMNVMSQDLSLQSPGSVYIRPCANVTQLLLQGDPRGQRDFFGYSCSAARYWALLEACPSLTTLKISLDYGEWVKWVPQGRTQRHIKRLQLVQNWPGPEQAADALVQFPCLEALYVEPCWNTCAVVGTAEL